MKILVVGSGGREHALIWKIARSPLVEKIYAAPGNAGIARQAQCVDITPDNLEGLADFAARERVDLTVVGPEAPLCRGIVDLFRERKLRIFGPSQSAAELEGSKIFCKELLRRNGIPTAGFRVFSEASQVRAFLKTAPFPLVVKADGLAAGKGAVVCANLSEAEGAIEQMMVKRAFGEAGARVLIEEFLSGVEASVIAFVDGRTIAIMETVQDHKRVYDGDRGPNTGGMGAYSPAPVAAEREAERVEREILVPVVHALNKEQRRFEGILYAGIMYTKSGPKVIEFNVRHGDPECQALVVRLKSDLVPILNAVIDGKLEEAAIEWDPRPAVCLVVASGGYPGRYEVGYEISGLAEAEAMPDTVVFHAGTMAKEGKVVTSGGRVLGVTALGADLRAAQQAAYAAARKINFTGMHYRTDIASKMLR
ncbi:MAG TPA: phosphoribosylamine--glycine ligase [Planctomycetota bacterium]|nr:phosphoribosylamine--glycine ligase [Planctomycetota bacterium]